MANVPAPALVNPAVVVKAEDTVAVIPLPTVMMLSAGVGERVIKPPLTV